MEQHKCLMEERVRSLETGQAETRIYVKEIREDIQEIKATLKNPPVQPASIAPAALPKDDSSKTWSPIVLELIKVLGTAITVIGAVVGALKLTGKG